MTLYYREIIWEVLKWCEHGGEPSDHINIGPSPSTDEERFIVKNANDYLNLELRARDPLERVNKRVRDMAAMAKEHIDFIMEILKENKHPYGLHKFFFVHVILLAYEKQLTIKQELDIEGYTFKLLKLYNDGVFKTLNENPGKKVIIDQNGGLTWY